MWLRGSAKVFELNGANRREASAMAGSISIVSTDSIAGPATSVCVVSPVPTPMTAARFASGLKARGSAPVSTIVISSEMRGPGFMLIAPSDLPLVRRLRPSWKSIRPTLVVLPSL